MMQHNEDRRRYHAVRRLGYASGVRFAVGGLIACIVVMSILTPGVAAETPDAVDAGNGGIATATGNSTLTAGDIYGGGNNGNSIMFGDIVNSTVEINGGTVTNPTVNILSMPAGTQIASADGGNDTQARLDEAGPPIDLDVDVRNRNRNSNKNASESSSTSNSTSNSTNNSTSNNSNALDTTVDNTLTGNLTNTNDSTIDNTVDNTNDNANSAAPGG